MSISSYFNLFYIVFLFAIKGYYCFLKIIIFSPQFVFSLAIVLGYARSFIVWTAFSFYVIMGDFLTQQVVTSTPDYFIPNIILKSALPKNMGLNVCLINIYSIRRAIRGTGVHILMISETWLSSHVTDGMEFLTPKLKTSSGSILLCCVYLPKPTARRMLPLVRAQRPCLSQSEGVIMGGDFNIDILSHTNPVLSSFKRILNELSLNLVLILLGLVHLLVVGPLL